MNIRNSFIALLISCISLTAFSQKGLDAPMTKAVMNVYKQLLTEDPTDYETYYRRACEYYKHNQYALALDDINNALKYVPDNESVMRIDCLTLRANIYQQQNNLEEALNDLNNAYAINPESYLVIYQKANIEFQLGKYSEAKIDYQRMQRINNRSQESFIGLARVAVKENNLGLANDYLNQAVAIAPSNSDIYVRRASVRLLMNNPNGAVDDLILAISTDNTNTRALQELVKLGDTHYSAVMNGLSNAISQAPKVGMFYYIRAVIAEVHYNYLAAITDYEKILNENLYNYYGIYNSLAKCQFALGKYSQALDNVDTALSGSTNKEYYVTKSKIKRATNDATIAVDFANKAIAKDPNYNEAIINKAYALIDLNQYDEATALLGEASLNDANNALLFLTRAWILENCMNKKSTAQVFYNRALDVETTGIKSLRGFALYRLGKVADANSWMQEMLSNVSESDGYEYYIATCFYAQTGDHQKALSYMKQSLESGYASYYDWTDFNIGIVNVSPIRDLPQFKELLNQYSIIFEK